jgi:hypothetical protein
MNPATTSIEKETTMPAKQRSADSPAVRLTKAEKDNLLKLAKLDRDGAIADITRKITDAIDDFEMQLAAEYRFDQREVWADLMHTAKTRVNELDSMLAEDCRTLGIPDQFRPSISLGWHSRGENAFKQWREELRRATAWRLIAMGRHAIEQTKTGYRNVMTSILSATITSEEARALLAAMPTTEELVPKIDFSTIKRSLLEGPEGNILRNAIALTDETDDDD